ncbi:MAG TPA: sterol carrier protein domain-containing protein, partial [Kofleriaceae bacterium]|nr:sterol carrier protein domain-containing protein [Kofleriaceae bacterium]
AGTFTRYRVPVAAIPVGPHDLEIERVPPDAAAAAAALGPLYDRVARRQNGFVDRTLWFWRRAVDPLRNPGTVFCVREAGAVTGYLILNRRWAGRGLPNTEISCREMVAETPGAARRLWTLLADERSFARELLVTGPPASPDHLLFAEQAPEVEWQMRWMLRICDVESALAARRYAPGIERRFALEVEDDQVARNRGRFTVELTSSRAKVSRGGGEPVRIGIRGLAALYSGYLSAEQLAAVGMASGASADLAALTTAFAGTAPWLAELF